MRTGCGLRSVTEIVNVFNEVFDGMLGRVPGYVKIQNWIKKCGLDVKNESCNIPKDDIYSEITDLSIMIGSEKLMLTLGIPSAHPGRSLNHGDVKVMGLTIRDN